MSLPAVVEDFIKRHSAAHRSRKLSEAIEDFVEEKKKAKGKPAHGEGSAVPSPRYVQDLRARLNRFSKDMGPRLVSDISARDLGNWLHGLDLSGVTVNNFRRVLSVFFKWAARKGYCEGNPAAESDKMQEVKRPPGIFTPSELRVLLDSAPPDLLPFFAIGAFAGLRPSEIERLDWKAVDWTKNRIDVHAKKLSRGGRGHRFVPINETLRAWILPFAKDDGRICGTNHKKRRGAFIDEIKVKTKARPALEWTNDVLRHSFVSYSVAREANPALVALWCGHNEGTLFTHYRARVDEDEAREYFAVLPASKERTKIVPFGAA